MRPIVDGLQEEFGESITFIMLNAEDEIGRPGISRPGPDKIDNTFHRFFLNTLNGASEESKKSRSTL